MSDIPFALSIHAPPKSALARDGDQAVEISFSDGVYPYVVLHCMSAALATDLAAAINGALAKHQAARELADEIGEG